MKINHHLDDATLLAYAAGALDESMSVVVASHLSWCSECRDAARYGDHLGGALIDEIDEQPMSDGALSRIMDCLDDSGDKTGGVTVLTQHYGACSSEGSSAELPPALARRLGVPISEIKWRMVAPGVYTHAVPLSSAALGKLFLVRVTKGSNLPEHGHGGAEMTLVLSGSYADEFGTFSAGDVADLDADVEHQPTATSDEDCICLVAMEAPTRFKGIVGRLMQPFTGM